MAIRKRVAVPEEVLIAHEAVRVEPEAKPKTVNPAQPDPRTMSVDELRAQLTTPRDGNSIEVMYRQRIVSPLSGIRAWCVTCADGIAEARRCPNVTCALWPFRMGKNPFFGKTLPPVT